MTRDSLDMRVLGAIRFVDAIVGTPILDPLVVTADDGVRIIRNRSGLYVIAEAPGAAVYTATVRLPEPPAPPLPPPVASVTVTLSVVDPTGRYLPRRATIAVPRDPDPANAAQATSLFQALDRALFPSPTARAREGWATLRISVKRTGTDIGLPFAYLRVRRTSNDTLLARGMADERGEALVGVPGIPVTTWSSGSGGAVTTSSLDARLVAYFDAAAFDPATATYPDPDQLDASFATLPHSADVDLALTSGHEVTCRIDVTLPP